MTFEWRYQFFFFIFNFKNLWYWGLNLAYARQVVYQWATFPALFIFLLKPGLTNLLSWLQTCDPPVSPSWVAGIISRCHHPYPHLIFKMAGHPKGWEPITFTWYLSWKLPFFGLNVYLTWLRKGLIPLLGIIYILLTGWCVLADILNEIFSSIFMGCLKFRCVLAYVEMDTQEFKDFSYISVWKF